MADMDCRGAQQAAGVAKFACELAQGVVEFAVGKRDSATEGNALAPVASMATGPALAIGKEEVKGFGGEAMASIAMKFLDSQKA